MNFPIFIDVTLESNNRVYSMDVEETMPSIEIELDMAVFSEAIQAPVYEGEYTVVPIVADNIVLETKDKLCEDDITVVKIPRYSTSNEYGTTFYIGEG